MKNPKVSVIIPVYNGEKTLKQCLDSVLNQTYKNYEVIVVDNNSTDKTKEIIKEFQKKEKGKNKKIKYLFEKQIGRGAARNRGEKKANGEIILMTDSDCIVPKNWIEEMSKPIIYENESAVMGFEKDLIKNFWTKNVQKANLDFIKRTIDGKYISRIDTKNFAIKTSIIKKLMFDSNLKALVDSELYLRLKKIVKVRFKPSIIVGHHHPSSFRELVKTKFEKVYCAKKIFEKHKKNLDLKNEKILESISFKNFLLFPTWIIFQFIKRPLREAYFILIADLSWRLGIVWSMIKK